ncbi:MAG: glycosyltransferase [Endomicrobium sp.]|nr:glycosyltransferase [Endomicrobium sp.]
MRLLRKTNNEDKKVYWLGCIEIFKVKYISNINMKYKKYYVFGVQVYKKKYIIDFLGEKQFLKFLKTLQTSYKIILFFDHSLGGGTEKYFFGQLNSLKEKYIVLRFQYFNVIDNYRLILYYKDDLKYLQSYEISVLLSIIKEVNLNEVVINNLVGYKKTLDILEIVSELKQTIWKNIKLSVRCHDFQGICPSFNLLNDQFTYCNVPDIRVCLKCFPKIKLSDNLYDHKILLSGADDIISWRKKWNDFFCDSVDEVVFFSNSTKDIFCKIYPILKNKLVIIPHFVHKLRKAKIKEHSTINIAIIGKVNLIQKGKTIIEKMISLTSNNKNIKIVIIGSFNYKKNCKNLSVTGRYKVEELPDIVEKTEIDIIFIPSICPETFSYVTSEAIMMDIPVACFNLGAQAERVSIYNKGLVINEISAEAALQESISFIKKK